MGKSKASFKNSVAQFNQIVKDIEQQKYSPIYLLMGEEGYFIDKLSDLIGSTILNEAERSFNQIVAYGADSHYGDVINYCKQMPMMGRYQVVILKEAQQLKDFAELSLYTKECSKSTIFVICHKEKNVDRRSVLYKNVAEHGVVFESVRPRDYEIKEWLRDFARSKGVTFEEKAGEVLVQHLGTSLLKIAQELDKLITSVPQGTKTITSTHIEEHVGISKDFNIFELTKALGMRDSKRALLIAEHFSKNERENPIYATLPMLYRYFRSLFILNYQQWLSRRNKQPMPDDYKLSRMIGVGSFFIGEYKQAARNYPNQKVFAILGLIREYDLKVKGLNVASRDPEILKELLLKILLL